MKGLLIKDFRLLKAQRNFFINIVLVAVVMSVFLKNAMFMIGYLAFVFSSFTLSTVSYDEYENGNAFLFSLPVSREGYVAEKYAFGILASSSGWLVATILAAVIEVVYGKPIDMDFLAGALTVLPLAMLIFAVMLPFQIKFGGEKGRIAMVAVICVMVAIAYALAKLVDFRNLDLLSKLEQLTTADLWTMMAVCLAAGIIALLVSAGASLRIMRNKEF